MGYNTTVIVRNDGLANIKNDPDFATKLVAAIMEVSRTGIPVHVSALGHVNAATVVETHHTDQAALITVGGNLGTKIDPDTDRQVRLMAEALVKIAVALGITREETPLTGPQLLMVAKDALDIIKQLSARGRPPVQIMPYF